MSLPPAPFVEVARKEVLPLAVYGVGRAWEVGTPDDITTVAVSFPAAVGRLF